MYYYVINPAAGRGNFSQIQERLRQGLKDQGIAGEFAKSTGPGDATKLTQLAVEKGYTTVVAVGGDGTVNEVINGLKKDNVAIGIIPTGKTNSLAKSLGIHDWQQAVAVLSARRLTGYGLIAAGQQYFLSTLTLGFETDMDKQVEAYDTGWTAKLRQLKDSWGHAQQFTPLRCHIKADDQFELECDIFNLSVSNQKFLNPLAENRLVVNIFAKPGRKQLNQYLWQLMRQTRDIEDQATTRFTASRLVLETKPVTGLMVDGKVTGRTPIAIRLTERRIRFITEKPASDFKPTH